METVTKTTHDYYLYEWNLDEKEIKDSKKIKRSTDKQDVEEVVADYYKIDLTVFNVEPIKYNTLNRLPDNVEEKVREHPSVTDEIPAGFPDLILYDEEENEIAYCEVKLNGDGLRFRQLKFITEASRPVSVAYVQEEEYEKTIQVRCSTCGATFDTEEQLEQHGCSIENSVRSIMDWEGYGFN